MTFLGINPTKSNIIAVLKDRYLEQVSSYRYLGCELTYLGDQDIHLKLSKYLKIIGILNSILKPNLVQKLQN
jgi:hypothetical protein